MQVTAPAFILCDGELLHSPNRTSHLASVGGWLGVIPARLPPSKMLPMVTALQPILANRLINSYLLSIM
jgi:hypothetical protein